MKEERIRKYFLFACSGTAVLSHRVVDLMSEWIHFASAGREGFSERSICVESCVITWLPMKPGLSKDAKRAGEVNMILSETFLALI